MKKLPNIVIHACKNKTYKNNLLKKVWPAHSALLYRDNSLWEREVLGSIPGSCKCFYVYYFVLLMCFIFCPKTLFVTTFAFFAMLSYIVFSIHVLNIGI